MTSSTKADSVEDVWEDWRKAVTMTASELEAWRGTHQSKSVAQGNGESTGHQSGRRIVTILRTKKGDLTDDDAGHMRKVVGYVHRHLGQRPSGDVTDTPWRFSFGLGSGPPGLTRGLLRRTALARGRADLQ